MHGHTHVDKTLGYGKPTLQARPRRISPTSVAIEDERLQAQFGGAVLMPSLQVEWHRPAASGIGCRTNSPNRESR